mmetsp:Transcript_50470/g.99323  ORF Transcript_50470/g.99323 Transcript_50470/m.99323 type:complete len:209 (-) Transcript_50470:260-886(-)
MDPDFFSPSLVPSAPVSATAAECCDVPACVIPISAGLPTWTGAPWAAGYLAVISETASICSGLYGRMDTTSSPPKAPLLLFGTEVLYIGTFLPSSTCLGGSPASSSTNSHEKEHPRRNPTKSSPQRSVTSVRSSTNFPSLHTLYLGTSFRRSAPSATECGQGSPGSVTSRSGQAWGFLRQKSKKSKANAFGRATRFACTKPDTFPGVG